jgi:hypothetical protein
MRIGRCPVLPVIAAIVAGCAASGDTAGGTPHLAVRLTQGTEPIADVEGPYGAVSMKDHAVAIRVWPNGLGDGLADVSIIVTNNSWNTLVLDPSGVSVTASNAGAIAVLDRDAMLASLEIGEPAAERGTGRDLGPLNERRSSQAARAADGSMAGTRMSGDIGATAVDPALMAAARTAPGTRRESPGNVDEEALAESRAAIDAWYLQSTEIYPGDTAAGGISFALPAVDDDLTIIISLAGQSYPFELRYERIP